MDWTSPARWVAMVVVQHAHLWLLYTQLSTNATCTHDMGLHLAACMHQLDQMTCCCALTTTADSSPAVASRISSKSLPGPRP
jgi:hypothetical protein